jgi:hypothetical protein
MELHFKIEANEILYDYKNSHYNNVCWELKKPIGNITHFIEHYDDVYQTPECIFGNIMDADFLPLIYGDFDRAIEEETLGFGGIWYDVKLLLCKGQTICF